MPDTSYRILSQMEQTARDDAGGFSDAVVVRFKTAKGNIASVSVPVASYTAEKRAAMVQALADELDADPVTS